MQFAELYALLAYSSRLYTKYSAYVLLSQLPSVLQDLLLATVNEREELSLRKLHFHNGLSGEKGAAAVAQVTREWL